MDVGYLNHKLSSGNLQKERNKCNNYKQNLTIKNVMLV